MKTLQELVKPRNRIVSLKTKSKQGGKIKMKIEIKTVNAAFHDCDAGNEYADYYTTAAELDRIFGQISKAVAEGRTDGKVIDSNGNICGEWKI